MENSSSNAERLTAACVLSIAGGFLDIYTYLCRGRVFANAVTGNMVLFGFHLSNLHWVECSRYLLAILCYALGIFVADLIHRSLPAARREERFCCANSVVTFSWWFRRELRRSFS